MSYLSSDSLFATDSRLEGKHCMPATHWEKTVAVACKKRCWVHFACGALKGVKILLFSMSLQAWPVFWLYYIAGRACYFCRFWCWTGGLAICTTVCSRKNITPCRYCGSNQGSLKPNFSWLSYQTSLLNSGIFFLANVKTFDIWTCHFQSEFNKAHVGARLVEEFIK